MPFNDFSVSYFPTQSLSLNLALVMDLLTICSGAGFALVGGDD